MTGPELKALREGCGLKANEIAPLLGLTPEHWSRYENGRSPIPPTVAYAALYLCEQAPPNTTVLSDAAARLVSAIKEVVAED